MSVSNPEKVYKDMLDAFLAQPPSQRKHKASWRAPTMMLSALMLGLVIALAQHFTYSWLNGKPVSMVPLTQAWVSRISTGLAFSAKVALTICVGVSYIQHQWLRLQHAPFKVREVDTLTGVLGNIFCFLESGVWFRYPMLALMALVTWTLPLSAIVTPGSLSVEPMKLMSTIPLQVPQPSYNFTNYGTKDMFGDTLSENTGLNKLLAYTASSSSPVPLRYSYPNQTYNLAFNGPALKCSSANDSVIYNSSITYGEPFYSPYSFAAWIPYDSPYTSPFKTNSFTMDSIGVARLLVMTNSQEGEFIKYKPKYSDTEASVHKVNVTECVLYNATYNINFCFQYPNQKRSVRIKTLLNPVIGGKGKTDYPEFERDPPDRNSYIAMMSALATLLVGTSSRSHYNEITNNGTNWGIVTIDWSRAEAVQRGLESLFQNFTLSLLSDPGLVKNASTAEWIPVDVETWPVTYVYNPTDLVIAYGLSFLAAIVCTVIGMLAFFTNDASYQNMFSTYLRATNDAGLAFYIHGNDAGSDPLPDMLGKARVEIVKGRLGEGDLGA